MHSDILVIGGGTCGCVVAARLSERTDRTVVLLEAGPGYAEPPGPLLDMTAMPVGPLGRWAREYPAMLTQDRPGVSVRGRVLGGSSAVNGGYFVRATPADIDGWGEGWSFDDALPFFVASEHDLDYTDAYHGSSGPLPVQRVPDSQFTGLSAEFTRACLRAGFAECADKNGPDSDGLGRVPMNIADGRRVSTAEAYLLSASARGNPTVLTGRAVHALIVESGRAVGVEVRFGSTVERLFAERIVLCCGAIESPAVLMRSGIGDSAVLERVGVRTAVELPGVGRTLYDHPEVALPFTASDSAANAVAPLQVVLNTESVEIRPYTAPMDTLVPGSGMQTQYLGVGLMDSRSRGSVTLGSTDPEMLPMVDFSYLTERSDRERLRAGVQVAQELLGDLHAQGVLTYQHVDPTDAWLADHLGTSQHSVGTCAMGAVVDNGFAVHGVENLYVVDTSVIPRNLSRGPNATAVMLAERAAELLVQCTIRGPR